MQAHIERRLHTYEVAELRIARAFARVSVQMFCSQCSRPHCIEQLNLLETLLAADLRRSLPTVNSLQESFFEADEQHLSFPVTLII